MVSVRELFTREDRSHVMLSITVIGGFLCLISLSSISNLENSNARDALRNGPMFRVVVVAAIALACPNIMNNLADYVWKFVAKKTITKKSTSSERDIKQKKIPIISDNEKLVFIIGILILPVVSSCPEWDKAILLSCVATAVQQQFVGGVIITSLNRFNGTYFPTFIAYFTLLLLTASSLAKSYSLNTCGAISPAECSKLSISLFQIYGVLIVVAIELGLILFWLSSVFVCCYYGEKVQAQYYRWPKWCVLCNHESKETINKRYSGIVPKDDYVSARDGLLFFRIVYCGTIISWVIFVITARFIVSTNFSHYDDKAMMLNFAPYLVFEFFALFTALRLVKHETVSGNNFSCLAHGHSIR